jgi:hypothetical protein
LSLPRGRIYAFSSHCEVIGTQRYARSTRCRRCDTEGKPRVDDWCASVTKERNLNQAHMDERFWMSRSRLVPAFYPSAARICSVLLTLPILLNV